MHGARHGDRQVGAVMVLDLVHQLAGDVAVNGSGTRLAERWRIRQGFRRKDALPHLNRKWRPVYGTERRLDEADSAPATRAQGVAVADR